MTLEITEYQRFAMQNGDSIAVPSGNMLGSASLAATNTYPVKGTSQEGTVLKVTANGAAHTFSFDGTITQQLPSGQSMLIQAPLGSTLTCES